MDLSNAIDSALDGTKNGFPFDVFPKEVQQLLIDAESTVSHNKEYLSAGILSACATAIGNSIKLDNGSYISKPIFWISIVGRPGTGKTHPLQFAKKPIENKDTESYLNYTDEVQHYEQQNNDRKGRKPIYSKFILKDFTPEKLAESLQYNKKGVLIFQDELMRWVNSFDQYNKGGDQQMYLELFNGGGLTVDRVSKEPKRIDETSVNILGGMQPDILKGFANNNRSQDGFLDRFLFVYPENIKPIMFLGKKIDILNTENYKRMIFNLMDAPTQIIVANTSSIEIYKQWQHPKIKECFNDYLELSIQTKLQTYVWRFALILEMMHQATNGHYNTTLKDKSIIDAIRLAEYFRINALKVHDRLLVKNPLEDITEAQRDLYDSLPDEFKRIDILPLFRDKNISISTGERFLKNYDLFHNRKTHKELKLGHYKKKNL